MARLFFHLHQCGSVKLDKDGTDLPDLDAARTKALQAARAVMCAEVAQGKLCLSCHVEVLNEAGEQLLYLPFREAITITGL